MSRKVMYVCFQCSLISLHGYFGPDACLVEPLDTGGLLDMNKIATVFTFC